MLENCECWLHLAVVMGLGRVEALTIGAVLGFSFVTWLGLMSVAARHYLGVARLTLLVLVAKGVSIPRDVLSQPSGKLCSQLREMLLGRSSVHIVTF